MSRQSDLLSPSPESHEPERQREEGEGDGRPPRDCARRPKRDEPVPRDGKSARAQVLFRQPLRGDLNVDSAAAPLEHLQGRNQRQRLKKAGIAKSWFAEPFLYAQKSSGKRCRAQLEFTKALQRDLCADPADAPFEHLQNATGVGTKA